MLSVAIHCLLAGWLVLSTWGASILQLHRGSSSSRSMSPASLPSAKKTCTRDGSFSIKKLKNNLFDNKCWITRTKVGWTYLFFTNHMILIVKGNVILLYDVAYFFFSSMYKILIIRVLNPHHSRLGMSADWSRDQKSGLFRNVPYHQETGTPHNSWMSGDACQKVTVRTVRLPTSLSILLIHNIGIHQQDCNVSTLYWFVDYISRAHCLAEGKLLVIAFSISSVGHW